MPATGTVVVNPTGTLSVRVGGASEWTNDSNTMTAGALGALIAGVGGQGNEVQWSAGSKLRISTLNAPNGALTYRGVIGSFHTAGNGSTDNVGVIKTGTGTTLYLTATNTFTGGITVEDAGGVLVLTGSNPNAGQSMTVPTVTIGTPSGTNATID